MEPRLQTINNDRVLTMAEEKTVTTRLSEKALTRQKRYLEDAIARFSTQLTLVEEKLNFIQNEASKQ